MKKSIQVISLLSLLLLFYSCSTEDEVTENEEAIAGTEENLTAEQKMANEIFDLVNNHRKSIGKAEFKRSTFADDLSKEHNKFMISQGKISHTNIEQRSDALRKKFNSRSVGENVALGYRTAKTVFNGWMESEGHKKNIEGNYTHIGIAVTKDKNGKLYFTQLFYR